MERAPSWDGGARLSGCVRRRLGMGIKRHLAGAEGSEELMPRYSRSVIPGRPQGISDTRDLDRMVFGDADEREEEFVAEEDADEEAGIEVEADAEADADEDDLFVSRQPKNRRKMVRRQSDYSRLPDDRNGRYEAQEGSRRGPAMLVGTLVIVAVFGVVVWNAYRDGIRVEAAEAAPMLASQGSFKTRSVKTGAPSDSAMSASVFDRMEASETTTVRTPESRPIAAEKLPEPEVVEVVKPAPAPVAVEKPAPEPAPKPEPKAVEMAEAAPAAAPIAPVAAPKPEPKPAASALDGAYTPKFVRGASHLVQIGAGTTREMADSEWARQMRKTPELLGDAEKIVVEAEVGGSKVYRIRVGAFSTADDANAFCAAFKAAGGDCFRAMR